MSNYEKKLMLNILYGFRVSDCVGIDDYFTSIIEFNSDSDEVLEIIYLTKRLYDLAK